MITNKIKKLFGMKKDETTNEEVFEQQIQAREESEAAADNIDAVSEPDQYADDPNLEVQMDQDNEKSLEELEENTFIETSAEAVGYENRESQWNIYRVMGQYINPESTITDFGCARGDFKSFFLSEYEIDLDYTGIDMNKQLIDAGLKINPDFNLIHTDWKDYNETSDWCINIGSHDVRYDANTVMDDKTYLMNTINHMYNCCNDGLAIMLASDILQQDEGIITWNAGEILNEVLTKFRTASIDHSYSDAIFTLIIYKND
tara:strand:+ start:2147 stop:2926 length:780 start_codon:yes stop_codon:yes gene_type:complete